MNDKKREFLHRLGLLGAVLLFTVIFFLLVIRGGDNLDAKFSYHDLPDGTITIEGYTGSPTKLKIPDSIDGKTVSEIYSSAFAYNETLTEVQIPGSVRTIGKDAFYNCQELRKVILKKGVETIGVSAFEKCSYLKSVQLPDGLRLVEAAAFAGCTRLGELTIPSSCQVLGDDVFRGCENLILNCTSSTVAAEYAQKHSITTDYSDSRSAFQLKIAIIVGISIAVAAVAFSVVGKLCRKRSLRSGKGQITDSEK